MQCLPSYEEAYDRCIIWSASSFTPTLRHELGHALGLADHIQVVYAGGPYVNPRLCDAPSLPEFSPYEGVMSYCAWDAGYRGWFGASDREMLADVGYAAPPAEEPGGVAAEPGGMSGGVGGISLGSSEVEAAILPAADAGVLPFLVFLPVLFRLSRKRRRPTAAPSSRSGVTDG